jgi:transcriptional regulator with XRE-family HTH domain
MTVHMASDTVGANIRMMRKNRSWSVAELAERCARLGAERLTAPVIENIEHGRRRNGERTRDITVDELTVIADALMVTPGLLFPEMISEPVRYENADDERDVIMGVILNNLEVSKRYILEMRARRAAVETSGSGKPDAG